MRYGTVAGIEKQIARVVQGTVMLPVLGREQSYGLLDAVVEAGANTFDTAHGYGNGEAERILGAWIESRARRDELVIITKGAHHNADRQRVTPFDITSDLHDSLARLRTDFIDLYLLHRDNPAVPVGPIVECLNEHLAAGRIHAFGGSNWSCERIEEANEYAAAHGLVPFAASSPSFSLAEQIRAPWENCVTISGTQGAAARAWYAREQMPLFTWSSLAGGFFTGRFTPDNLDSFDDYFDRLVVESYCCEANFSRLERARLLAAEKGVTLPQIALAYVMNQPLNIFALVGSRTGDELRDNVAAAEIPLSRAEMAWLNLEEDDTAPAGGRGTTA